MKKSTSKFLMLLIFSWLSNNLQGQERKVVIINQNVSWKECIISYWNAESTIPITFQDMWASGKIKKDSYKIEIETTEPIFLNFAWNFKIQIVYLFPGDTLKFKSSGNEISSFQFSGTRSEDELMFYSRLESSGLGYLSSGNQEIAITEQLNYNYVAEKTRERYESRLRILKNANHFSQEGYNLVKNSLYFHYLSELLFPYQAWKPLEEIGKESVNVPQAYKNELLKLQPQYERDSMLNLLDYKRFILQYGRFLMLENTSITNVEFEELISFYKDNLTGQKRDILLYDETRLNFQMTGDLSGIESVIGILENQEMCDTLVAILDKNKRELSQVALNSILENPSGKRLTLHSILKDSKYLTYIDFWATWCGPCIIEMPYSQGLIDEFQNSDVIFVYISVDKDRDLWLKKLSKLPTGKNIRHFRSVNNVKMLNLINTQSVPRYILVGENTRMISSNAPRPGSREIRNLILKNMDKN